jgi:hypothetical protein
LLARREPAGESDYNAVNCQGEAASYMLFEMNYHLADNDGQHYPGAWE